MFSAQRRATRYLLLSPIIATPRKQHTRAILNIKVHKHILIACLSYIFPSLSASLSISRARISAFHYSFTLYFTPHTITFLAVLDESSRCVPYEKNYSNMAREKCFY